MEFHDYIQLKNIYLEIRSNQKKITPIKPTISRLDANPSSIINKIKIELNIYLTSGLIDNQKLFNYCEKDKLTDFQQKFIKHLISIPTGETRTYKDLSLSFSNSPNYARALGQSINKNPFLLIVPCHRITSLNDIGGFILGKKIKMHLLNIENHK